MEPASARSWRYSTAIAGEETQCVGADAEKQYHTVVPESFHYSMKPRGEQCGEES